MDRLFAFLALTILISCNNKAENKTPDTKTQAHNVPLFDRRRLDYYFAEYEIKPSTAVNNTEFNQKVVQLSEHTIKWLDTEDDTKIKIGNDLFTLKNDTTLNFVWEKKDGVDFTNNWDEMKLYKINGRELIGIKMSFHPCTGLGCSVNYFLIYDLQTKTRNYFGTFRTEDKLALYNFNNDDKLDYISKTFRGDPQGSTPMEFIYELYSMENNGQLVQQKNSNGQPYQVKQTTFPNDTARTELFEQRWFTEIK